MYMPKWYKDSSDYTKINLQAWDVYFMLKELKSRLEFSALRLKHAIRFHNSRQEKAELRFQQRILNEHLKQINQMLEKMKFYENGLLKRNMGSVVLI